jgi:hypothetical protein
MSYIRPPSTVVIAPKHIAAWKNALTICGGTRKIEETKGFALGWYPGKNATA